MTVPGCANKLSHMRSNMSQFMSQSTNAFMHLGGGEDKWSLAIPNTRARQRLHGEMLPSERIRIGYPLRPALAEPTLALSPCAL